MHYAPPNFYKILTLAASNMVWGMTLTIHSQVTDVRNEQAHMLDFMKEISNTRNFHLDPKTDIIVEEPG
jgi:hypothetical protein